MDATILGIYDHHKLGDLTTSTPLECWIRPIGCSNTVIKEAYDYHGVEIPKNIAGMMLCAILSDTVIFKSPTCTKIDTKVVKELAEIADNIVIKVPLIEEGLKATKILAGQGIKTNVTLCFSPVQALMAAKAGAAYISPFVGRLDDISHIGMELVEQILAIYDAYGFETEVIVASIRNPVHVLDSALMGADIATIPFKVIQQLIKHPLTDIGLENFLADWKKLG